MTIKPEQVAGEAVRPTVWRDDILQRFVSDEFMRGPRATSDYINAYTTPGVMCRGKFKALPAERHEPLREELWKLLHAARIDRITPRSLPMTDLLVLPDGVRFEVFPVACDGEPNAHGLRLHIDHQSVQISGGPGFGDKEEAEWMAGQLRRALERLAYGAYQQGLAASVSLDALRGLVEKWRDKADECSERAGLIDAGNAVAYDDCSDDLSALITPSNGASQ